MKSKIHQQFIPHLEVFFESKGVKFRFLGTEIVRGGAIHTVQNCVNEKISDIPHSILENIVDFETKPILI